MNVTLIFKKTFLINREREVMQQKKCVHSNIDVFITGRYHPQKLGGKFLLWMCAIPEILRLIKKIRSTGNCPIIYSLTASYVSLFRRSIILLLSCLVAAKTVIQFHSDRIDRYLNSLQNKLPRLKAQLLTGIGII